MKSESGGQKRTRGREVTFRAWVSVDRRRHTPRGEADKRSGIELIAYVHGPVDEVRYPSKVYCNLREWLTLLYWPFS